MKNSILIFALLLFSIAANAQNTSKKETKKVKTTTKSVAKKSVNSSANVNGPIIEFETEVIDYGDITKGSDGNRKFYFKNIGIEPLFIRNVISSCGCVVVTYTKEPIMPGQRAEITARYDTNREGPFQKKIIVTTNELDDTKTLVVKGRVTAKDEQTPNLPSSPLGN